MFLPTPPFWPKFGVFQLKLLKKVSSVSFCSLTLREDDFDEVASWDILIKHSDLGIRRHLIRKRNLTSDSRHPIEKKCGRRLLPFSEPTKEPGNKP